MNCPRCKEELSVVNISGTTVDKCNSCGGLWLDLGELEKVKSSPDKDTIDTGDEGNLQNLNCVSGQLSCPRCENLMDEINYLVSSGIKIDRCPVCEGIWLDKGEFNAIVKYLQLCDNKEIDEEKLKDILKKERERIETSDQLDKLGASRFVTFFYRLFGKVEKKVNTRKIIDIGGN